MHKNHIVFLNADDIKQEQIFELNPHSLCIFNPSYNINFFEIIPKKFIISSNNRSFYFNTELLKDTSSVISKFILGNPENLHFHIDIEDENNVLEKLEQLYQGKVIIVDEKDFSVFNQITLSLNILDDIPISPGQENHSKLASFTFVISKNSFYDFISNISFPKFSIITRNHKYKCNPIGIQCSKVISNFLSQEPNKNCFYYDFDDSFSEFQFMYDFFNCKMVDITTDNMQSLKKIAEDLQITPIIEDIDKYIKEHDQLMETVDDQQLSTESIEKLFHHLYHIKELPISRVKIFIESEWSNTIEKVQELAAFILQVVKSDFRLHNAIIDLLLQLNNNENDDEEENETNQLPILVPFIVSYLMNSFGESKHCCSLIVKLRREGLIQQEDILKKLRDILLQEEIEDEQEEKFEIHLDLPFNNNNNNDLPKKKQIDERIMNIFDWFLPEMFQIRRDVVEYIIKKSEKIKKHFFMSFLPDKLDKYKEMLDSGEPTDMITIFLRNDDVDSLRTFIINEKIDIFEKTVPYNIYEDFVENGDTTYLNYAAAYGSIKCFKFLLLNHMNVDSLSFECAVYGGSSEIIRIVDQNMTLYSKIIISCFSGKILNIIIPAIKKHRNDLLDWILEEKIKNCNFFNELATVSIQNGNAHSLFEIMNKGFDLLSNQQIIQFSNENGFYTLSKIIFDIIIEKVRNPNFSSIYKSFVSFGNLSIFLLFVDYIDNKTLTLSLKVAVEFSHLKIIEYFFEKLIFTKKIDIQSKTIKEVLSISALKNDFELFNYLINEFQKMNPSFYQEFSWSREILPNACKNGKIKIVEKIIEIIYKFENSIENDITTSFIQAAIYGHIDILKYLTNSSLTINYETLSKSGIEMKSINSEIFSFMIEKSPENLKDKLLSNFIYVALYTRNKDLAEYILKQKNDFENSLIHAVETNDLDIVDLVLKYNKKSSLVNKVLRSRTPLCIAVKNNNLPIVQRLLSLDNIDPNLRDQNNPNPLQIACDKNYIEICERLLQMDKIDPNIENPYIPLHISLIYKRWEIVEMLLEHPKIKIREDEDDLAILISSKKIKLIKLYADKGSTEAMVYYSNVVGEDKEEAIKYMKKAADNGNVKGMLTYGSMLESGDGNYKEAAQYYKMASDKGSIEGSLSYALMLVNGKGVEVNKEEAAKYFKLGAEKGNIKAIVQYGQMLLDGIGVPVDEEEAARHFRQAAFKGHPDGMFYFGHVLYSGRGVSANKRKAIQYYINAANSGSTLAMIEYGNILENENNGAKKEEAKRYYKMAANKGNPIGINNYGWILLCTGSEQEDYEEACQYFKKAADMGNLNALFNYGFMLDNGLGIPINHEEAERCYNLVIEKGRTDIILLLAERLEEGKGLAKNEKEALRYYKMAADAGCIDAMFSYAKMRENDCDAISNKEEAIRYYKMAAEKGHADAMKSYQRLTM
ncbi:hypothetical protein M9Y10_036992 [Tritrichomonas musculus]|uniref:Uncharacterized protein n=1 Tax=Tritrichomonas musculus TaxID=1915356 RepID=A0ABR2GTJ3_9EUKA